MNPFFEKVKWHYDEFDSYRFTQIWRFALVEYLRYHFSVNVPGYQAGYTMNDSYAFNYIQDYDPSQEEAQYAYDILTRYSDILVANNKDY